MGLEHVKKDLLAEAEQEVKHLHSTAREQTKKEMQQAHLAVEKFEEETTAQLAKEKALLERQYTAQMALTAKKILLQKKKELLDDIFSSFRTEVSSLSQAERKKILTALFQKAKKECQLGKVYCAAQDIAVMKQLFAAVEQKPMLGGIIVESKDGTMRFDYGFDSILSQLYEQKMHEVNALLFG